MIAQIVGDLNLDLDLELDLDLDKNKKTWIPLFIGNVHSLLLSYDERENWENFLKKNNVWFTMMWKFKLQKKKNFFIYIVVK